MNLFQNLMRLLGSGSSPPSITINVTVGRHAVAPHTYRPPRPPPGPAPRRIRAPVVRPESPTETQDATTKELQLLVAMLHEAKTNKRKTTCKGTKSLYQAEIERYAARIAELSYKQDED